MKEGQSISCFNGYTNCKQSPALPSSPLLSQSSFLFKLQFSSSSSCCSFRLMLMAKTRQSSSSAMANSNFFYMKTSLPRKMGKMAFCTTSCRFYYLFIHIQSTNYSLGPSGLGPLTVDKNQSMLSSAIFHTFQKPFYLEC